MRGGQLKGSRIRDTEANQAGIAELHGSHPLKILGLLRGNIRLGTGDCIGRNHVDKAVGMLVHLPNSLIGGLRRDQEGIE